MRQWPATMMPPLVRPSSLGGGIEAALSRVYARMCKSVRMRHGVHDERGLRVGPTLRSTMDTGQASGS
ncbi:Hypothetical predicted protein, partial [Pelobates cultripes]